ncbi:MAG: rRNA maturation RNase YbeY [Candidatus Omnitrophica bacterium]|nr:rRNA maturation RNase YbeY [Candidatus Omnitrophota bacterium]
MEILLRNLQKKIPIPASKILKAAKAAFRKIGWTPLSLSIVFAGGGRMRRLNKQYLNHDYVTDVLAFDLGGHAGEVIVCPSMASSNAKIYGVCIEDEIVLYVVHGILHLAGYDDHKPQDIKQMRLMEQRVLRAF